MRPAGYDIFSRPPVIGVALLVRCLQNPLTNEVMR